MRELHPLIKNDFKDNYVLKFLGLPVKHSEKRLQEALVENMKEFILELGKEFIYIGKEFQVQVGNSDFYIDLLFFHVKLNCFVVVELKNTPFELEYAGKLNFYLSLVDEALREPHHNPTIGILLCKKHKKYKAEYALRNISSLIGVSGYELIKQLPDQLQTELPTIEEL